MTPNDDLVTPDWALQYVDAAGAIERTTIIASDDYLGGDGLPKGLKISVSGAVTARSSAKAPSYIYLLQIGADDNVAVLYPGAGAPADLEKAGTTIQLPVDPASFFTLPIDGRVRVVESSKPVDPAQWPKLIRGRDPMPEPTTSKNSVV